MKHWMARYLPVFDGNEPTGGGQQQQQQGTEGAEPPKWAQDLAASMATVGTGIGKLVQLAEASATRQPAAQQSPPQDDDDPDDLLENNNLEMLPRRDFARKLLESFEGTLTKALKPLQTQIENTHQNTLANAYMQEAEKFAAKTPDFVEWAEEMGAIAKDNPTLSMARIYAIAKAENPTKAAEVAKKYAKDEGEKKPASQPRRPFAMPPSSNESTVKNQRMNAEDAARAAWDETVAKLGSNPFA